MIYLISMGEDYWYHVRYVLEGPKNSNLKEKWDEFFEDFKKDINYYNMKEIDEKVKKLYKGSVLKPKITDIFVEELLKEGFKYILTEEVHTED